MAKEIDEFAFDGTPINETLVRDLAGGAFLAQQRNLVLIGATGTGNGVGVPVFWPDGRLGQCGLRFRKGVQRLDPEVLKQFQWVCELAHLRYCALVVPALGPLPELSPRETEVLAWVARGKSNPLIAEIHGISGHMTYSGVFAGAGGPNRGHWQSGKA